RRQGRSRVPAIQRTEPLRRAGPLQPSCPPSFAPRRTAQGLPRSAGRAASKLTSTHSPSPNQREARSAHAIGVSPVPVIVGPWRTETSQPLGGTLYAWWITVVATASPV